MDGDDFKFDLKEKKLTGDLYDLIEYVKWVTNETSALRKRVREAEQIINQLRRAGEGSVESLLDTLLVLRKKQEKLDKEANILRETVQNQEAMIKMKEGQKGNLKASIEVENGEHQNEMNKLRRQLEQQRHLI